MVGRQQLQHLKVKISCNGKQGDRLAASIVVRCFLMLAMAAFSCLVSADRCDEGVSEVLQPVCTDGRLDGRWFAYPGALVSPGQIDLIYPQAELISLPSHWLSYVGSAGARASVTTLWADIEWPQTEPENLAIWPGEFGLAYRVYVVDSDNNSKIVFDSLSGHRQAERLLNSNRPPSPSSKVADQVSVVNGINPPSRVVVHAYHPGLSIGDFLVAPIIAPYKELQQQLSARILFHSGLLGAFVLLAVYSLVIALFGRKRRGAYGMLLLVSLVAGFRLASLTSIQSQVISLDLQQYHYLWWLSLFSLASVLALGPKFLVLPAGAEKPALPKISITVAVILAMLIPLAFLLPLSSYLLIARLSVVVLWLCAAVYAGVLWFYGHKQGDYLPFTSVALLLIGVSFDAYHYSSGGQFYAEASILAVFLFVALQLSYMLGAELSAFKKETYYRLELEKQNAVLGQQLSGKAEELELIEHKLSIVAHNDVLTGLYNQRAFDKAVRQEVSRSKRIGHPMSVAIAGVDWLDKVVDNYGDEFGDEVVLQIGHLLKGRLRVTDFVARVGEDEFAFILPNTSSSEAVHVLKCCCEDVRNLNFPTQAGFQASISIGIANWQEWTSSDEMYKRADEALTQAKNQGRDRVVYGAAYLESSE